MNKLIVATYKNEVNAHEGLHALRDLHINGDITLFASAVIAKNDNNQIYIKYSHDDEIMGTVIGFASGGVAGFFLSPIITGATPVTATTFGAAAGGMTALIYDLNNYGTNGEFTYDISKSLAKGDMAVIADVSEEWAAPVDFALRQTGAKVYRRPRTEVVNEQYDREVRAFRKELSELKHEWKDATDIAKRNIEKQIEDTKIKLKTLSEKSKHEIEERRHEYEERIKNLREQVKTASKEQKEKIEKRMKSIQADFVAQKQLLEHAMSSGWKASH